MNQKLHLKKHNTYLSYNCFIKVYYTIIVQIIVISQHTYLWTYIRIPFAHRPIHTHTLTVVTCASVNFRFFMRIRIKKALSSIEKWGIGSIIFENRITSKSHKYRTMCTLIFRYCRINEMISISVYKVIQYLRVY